MTRFMFTALTALTLALALPWTVAAQGNASPGLTIPVNGTGDGAAFTGTLQLQRFDASGDALRAIGVLTGTVTTAGGAVTSVARNVSMPATVTQATCDILHLDLGPLNLDLLGLQINLSQIVLDIVAQSGAGNLLGNLLCAVVGLLDSPGGLADLLNQILGILG
jgi:hypothetical protein